MPLPDLPPALRARLVAGVLMLGCSGGLARAEPLVFLGNPQIPPVVFQRDGVAQGVAVDLTRALAARAGLDVAVRTEEWQAAQQKLDAGLVDALIQINPTPEREKKYDFSDVLLDSDFHLFVRNGPSPLRDLASLQGRRVGVEGGGFPIQFLKPHAGVQLVTVASWRTAFEMLRDGQLDAVFVDRWVGEYELSLNRIEGIRVVQPPLVSSQSRIAVGKGRGELLAQINSGLAALARDGTRQSILERWQGKQVVYVTRQEFERSEQLLALLAIALLSLGVGALALHTRGVRRRNALLLQAQQQLQQALDNRTQALDEATQARAATELLLAEQRAILDTGFIGLLRTDLATRTIVWANNAACHMLGYAPGTLPGLPTRALFVSQEDYDGFAERCTQALQNGVTLHEEVRQLRRDGSMAWHQVSVGLLHGQIAVSAIVDITERKRAEDETAYLAYFDALTGLANRRLLNNRIRQALAQSKRSARHGALLFLDLDNFKPLNDQHGHELGDHMLKEVAHRLTHCVREVDTVARFGGDEFVVLLSEIDSDAHKAALQATEVADKIRISLAAPYLLEAPGLQDGPRRVSHTASASVGVVLFGNGQPDAAALMVRVDAAMYAAKAAGRDRVVFA